MVQSCSLIFFVGRIIVHTMISLNNMAVIFILFQTFRAIFFQTLLKHSGSLENMHLNMRPCMYMLTHCFTFYHLF